MLGFRNGAGAGIIPSFWGISWVVVVVCQACWHLGKPTAQGAGLHRELPRATPCLLVLLCPHQWQQQVGGPVCFHGKHRITQLREPEIFIFPGWMYSLSAESGIFGVNTAHQVKVTSAPISVAGWGPPKTWPWGENWGCCGMLWDEAVLDRQSY